MKRGEAFFDKEEFAEAIVEYQHFLELHRAHQLAVYAQLRLAESHLRMAKSIDRDPEPIQKAIAAFEKLRKDAPVRRSVLLSSSLLSGSRASIRSDYERLSGQEGGAGGLVLFGPHLSGTRCR